MDLSSFEHHLPIKVKEIASYIYKAGFKLGILGGTTRDYILHQTISNDFDCELRPLVGHTIEEWEHLVSILDEKYGVEKLNYNIIRISFSNMCLELTLPRIEHYDGHQGHSNFKAEYIPDLEYDIGFARRDFTLNAIMFEFNGRSWDLKDPLNGVIDLQNKILKNCSNLFAMDPVRFLRAFRFQDKLKLKFSEELTTILENMPIQNISNYYLKYELEKSGRPLYCLKKMMSMRLDLIDDLTIHSENKPFILYDKLFNKNLAKHIKYAVILPVQSRKVILERLGFSNKNILPSIVFEESWKSLSQHPFTSEQFKIFYDVITMLETESIQEDRLIFLLAYYDISFEIDFFNLFRDTKYLLTENDKMQDKESYRYIKFQNRFKAVMCM